MKGLSAGAIIAIVLVLSFALIIIGIIILILFKKRNSEFNTEEESSINRMNVKHL